MYCSSYALILSYGGFVTTQCQRHERLKWFNCHIKFEKENKKEEKAKKKKQKKPKGYTEGQWEKIFNDISLQVSMEGIG